jgi:hypothetical protein
MYRWMAPLVRWRRPAPWGLVLIGSCVALLGAAALSVAGHGKARPSGTTTAVTACGLDVPGAAQVAFQLTNGDLASHGYRVHVSVTDGRTVFGSGISLVNNVAAGTTSSARALVPVTPGASHASCAVHAEIFDVDTGHHA